VLSFGEEVEEEEKEAEIVKDKIKSIHDVLDDPRFLKEDQQKEQLVYLIVSLIFLFLCYNIDHTFLALFSISEYLIFCLCRLMNRLRRKRNRFCQLERL
jgi:hypothetical protein